MAHAIAVALAPVASPRNGKIGKKMPNPVIATSMTPMSAAIDPADERAAMLRLSGSRPRRVRDKWRARAARAKVAQWEALMAKPEKIGADAALAKLIGWRKAKNRDAIIKEFRFKDFSAAFAFMTRAALKAEQLDHHPEWLNVYNRVEVTLATHDAGGVTERDIALAEAMNRLAGAAR